MKNFSIINLNLFELNPHHILVLITLFDVMDNQCPILYLSIVISCGIEPIQNVSTLHCNHHFFYLLLRGKTRIVQYYVSKKIPI